MDSSIPVLSPSGCLKLSVAGCEQLGQLPSVYNMLIGYIPLNGFGTFSGLNPGFTSGDTTPRGSSSQFSTGVMLFNDTWPNVYSTLTESWTDSTGSGGGTITFSSYVDIIITYSPGAGDPPAASGLTLTSLSDTSCTVGYTDGNGNAGVYTATLSGLFDAATGWAGLVAQAHALLAHASIPTDGSITLVQPISTSPGYVVMTDMNVGQWGVLGSAYGVGGRWLLPTDPGESGATNIYVMQGDSGDTSIGPTICDSPAYVAPTQGLGFVLCINSTWTLFGAPPGMSPPDANTTDHLTIFGQQMTFDSGTGAVAMASSVVQPSSLTLNGSGYTNPIPINSVVTFLDTDVNGNTGYTYGLLGFWNTKI